MEDKEHVFLDEDGDPWTLSELLSSKDYIHADVVRVVGDDLKLRIEWEYGGGINFLITSCPTCSASGAFRWRFLGRLTHSPCGTTWLVTSWEYLKHRLWRMTKGIYGGSNWGYVFFIGWWLEVPLIAICILGRIVFQQPSSKRISS